MNFDISKLGAGQSKGGESKAKSRFGPAVRAVGAAVERNLTPDSCLEQPIPCIAAEAQASSKAC